MKTAKPQAAYPMAMRAPLTWLAIGALAGAALAAAPPRQTQVPESALGEIRARLRPGEKMKVTAAPSGANSGAQSGELSFLNNAVDAGTGTILLKGTFANEDEALWPGEFVDVVLTLGMEPKAIVVPSQAVQTGQAGQFVWVVKKDLTVESRPVTVTRTQGPLAIVAKGLEAGERVVTDGQLRLAPGAKVEIRPLEGKPA